jgi:glucokinase
MKAIGIDLGGTRIKAVAIDEDGKILQQHFAETKDGEDAQWKKTIARTIGILSEKINQLDCPVGISAPGIPDEQNRCIAFMPGRMQGLENFQWDQLLRRKVTVLNDAVAALMAEARYGACHHKKHAIMLTLGTGVGGAILINGQPYQGAFNKAGHLGHMVIDHLGEADITGIPGSLEDCIGNCTIQKRTQGKYSSTHELIAAAENGNAWAKEIWLLSVRQLAIGISSLTNILSPEIVVIGGGIAEAGDALFLPLEKFMEQYEWRTGGNKVEIKKAAHQDLAGAIGAAAFALTRG